MGDFPRLSSELGSRSYEKTFGRKELSAAIDELDKFEDPIDERQDLESLAGICCIVLGLFGVPGIGAVGVALLLSSLDAEEKEDFIADSKTQLQLAYYLFDDDIDILKLNLETIRYEVQVDKFKYKNQEFITNIETLAVHYHDGGWSYII